MHVLKKYKMILLSGLLVVVFCVAAYFLVERADSATDTYAAHIFQEDTVNEINIEIDEADWQDMLENPLEEEYHKANVTINGETIGNVAIRTKGNNSLTSVANSDSDRYSFKLDFDYYDNNGNYYGLKKLCLNNNYSDNSSMREYISYKIMGEMGLDVPECAYSHITVNGEEWGLYLAVEPVDEVFLAEHFADATGDLYKPEGVGGTGADLVYNGDDISAYTGLNLKTNLNSSDGKEILALMQALEDGEGLEEVLDVEKALKYIAANVALANFDSYLGNTTHNFYLYEENGRFTIIPWDMNLAFGGFGGGEVDIYEPTKQGMGGFGGGDKRKDTQDNDAVTNAVENTKAQADANNQPQPPDNADMQGMPSMDSGEKPLVTTLLENEIYRSMYEGYLKEIAEKYFTQEYMTELVTKIHDLIAPYVQNDPTAFCTYEEFEQACSTDPTDQYSLVYYAVNMAESIENQLNGGEPTFNTSSMQGGGFGGGKQSDFNGEMPDMASRTEQTTDAQQNAQQNDRPTPPDQNGGQQGGQMDENERSGQQSSPPDFGGGEKTPPGMPGQDNKSVRLSDCLPTIAVCGGVFVVGVVVLILFKRKKDLKPPKENKTE
ncbi:CotH kinase family protein [Anaerotignum faecicola]